MYSYFVFLSMNDGTFIQLNVCSGLKPEQVAIWLAEFFKAVDARLKALHKPERTKDAFRFRILLDPAHHDDVIWPGRGKPLGGFKLSGEFPGRCDNSPI